MIEIFQYEFMRNALMAGVIAAVLCGVIGVYVILNRIVFISGGIAHTAFGGDTAIGVFWASGMSLGIVFVSLSRGYAPDLFDYLFGNILAVSQTDVELILGLTLVMILVVALLYKELMILSFDPSYGEAMGLPVRSLRLLLLCMVALSVVVLIKIVGIILVIALLTIPGAIGRQHADGLKGIMIIAILLGIVFVFAGLVISYYLDIPSGATIILTAAAVFFASTAVTR
jgi:zinc transport system permease protein